MTDQKPDAGDPTESTDASSTSPESDETTAEQTADSPGAVAPDTGSAADAGEEEATQGADDVAAESGRAGAASESSPGDAADDPGDAAADAAAATGDAADEAQPSGDAEPTEGDAGTAAAAATGGAAWTTTPVAPDPEATEAALAALAAKPEVTLEPPETPPPPPPGAGGEPPDEGTPVLLVGGILVGAFVVALAIVLILFRPFDSPTDVEPSLSPSPVVTEVPSASPTAIPAVDTPNFQGLSLDEAELQADDYGLFVRAADLVETDEFEEGTVLNQEPAPGEAVEPGTTIELSVAVPLLTQPVPDVVDMTSDDAAEAIEDAGFVVGEVFDESSAEIAAGNVIRTDPEVASELPAGSTIDLVVSVGPSSVPVPDIVDLPEAEALTALETAGLVPGDRSEANDELIVAGNIISSDPLAADEVAPGSEVAYLVSVGPSSVPVPDIVDLPEAEALTALETAGLVPGDRSEANDELIVAGNIISSDPLAADEVAPGSEVAYLVSVGPSSVPVPDIVDLPEAEALTALETAGLVPGDRSEANDELIVAGNIISSDPLAADEVAPGSEVAYLVSVGPSSVPVPDIVDLPEAEALTALETAGLVPGDRSEANDELIVAGNIISSDPLAADEVAPGSEVAYLVSVGPSSVPVPDIVDLPEAEALTALETAGLVPGDRSEANDELIVAGNIISSDPLAADEVAPGSEVAYLVSVGPSSVPVPDIVDLPEAEALTALETAGLVPGDRSEANDELIVAGNIISSDPLAADEVAPGSEVAYLVSVGPSSVPVPDIVDLPEAEALTALETAGLVPGDRSEANDELIVAGNIISSDPLAADEVAPGSEVAYLVSVGPSSVPVPDIVDLPEAEALTALETAGLVPGDRSEANDELIVAGNIISSDPLAADEVAPGSEVAYLVSVGPSSVPVPDIVDLPEAEALTALETAGLVPGDRSEANDELIVAGNIISSDPLAADEVAPGSEVAYLVSVGPSSVPVPDIVDLPEAEALTALETAGLVPGDRSEANDELIVAGNIISSDPLAADEVAPGSEVAYLVSVGPSSVPVPDIVDLPEAEALTALETAGLVPGDRSEANDELIVAGNIISSDPLAADEVAPGSEVAYLVSVGPSSVPVPDIVDLPEAEALTALETAGLVPGDRSEANDELIVAGNIISSDPLAADEVAPGSEVAYLVSVGPSSVPVPDIVDLPEAEALTALETAGLVPGDRSEANDELIVAGNIISQDPSAGSSVDIGSTVSYVVSLGVQQVEVPDLSGAAADAEETLATAGLAGSSSEAFSDSIAAGDVISQDPSAGSSVDIGSTVSYVVSLGVQQVEVPDLSGAAADAEETLATAGLAGSSSEAFSDSIAAGDVISQDPSAGSSVDIGSTVSYVVSLGVQQVEVPDLSGAAADAEETLATAGLAGSSSEAFSDSIAAGDVISQDPSAGSSVDIGSTVSYVVSLGVQQVEVPDLSGAAADAEETLATAGLAGSSSEAFSDSIAAGDVISQDPSAGSSVDIGSTVSYVVSLGVQQVEVPDLSGAAADAEETLATAGLAGSSSEAFSDSIAAGDVISQDPSAGSSVDIGSTVSYVVSLGVQQVEVPDLSGAAADAEETLATAGLAGSSSEAFSDTIVAGDVISQDPSAGSSVDIGSTVSYVVSLGVQQVEVPDLSGAAADAEETLATAGLAGSSSEAFSDTIVAGDVISQDPSAGSSVDIGSTVSYVVSLGVQQVEVPDLSGAAADAEETLATAGLAGSSSEAFSDSIAAGDVISQDPSAGSSVDIGSTVSYVVSLGVQQVEVPDLSGAAADAEETLATAGLAGSSSEAFSDSIAAGDVISQDPSAGSSVDIGSTVSYVVSLGVQQVEVPDLSGAAADAEETLATAGLAGSSSEAFSDSIVAGDVISQDPSAGSSVDIGSTVSYVVSLGVQQVEVPDLSGAAADAEETLATAGLAGSSSEAFSDSIAAGDVISQDPSAGSSVDIGSTVSYVVSLGVQQVEVPDLSGAAADAEETLATAGLAGSSSEAFSDSIAAGDVISQDPSAGSSVDIGSTVSYVVSLGATPSTSVPDVRNLPESEAVVEIEAADLVLSDTIEQTHEKVAAGDAIKTDPAAGTELLYGSQVTLYVSTGSSTRTIPEVRDQPAGEAQAALEAEGLVVSTEEKTNAQVAAGDAVKTDPAAGAQVAPGSEVLLTISRGPKPAVVPDITGSLQKDAKAAITAAGLTVGESSTVQDDAPKNTVLSQEPAAAAEVPQGTAVDYILSSGPALVTIPEVRDQPAGEAQAALEAEGLVVSTEEKTNAQVAAGDAVKTDSAAGAQVAPGSEVLLTISRGPKPAVVPDITGSLQKDAKAAITAAGLTVGESSTVQDDAPKNTVLSQEPAAAAEVPQGTAVDYILSSGPALVTIPEVRDQPAGEAQAALEAEGLVVSTEEKTNAQVAAGDAVKTDPAAGAQVAPGSEVLLTISRGPKPAVVPDITGSLQKDAKAAITAAGLTVGESSTVQDDAPKNTVLSQEPAAAAEVPQGTAVDYILSSGPALVTIPEVRDQPAGEAQAALEAEGLVVSTEEKTNAQVAAGDAVKTDPAAGAQVAPGSEVLLTISRGPKPAVVPDITGSLQKDAKAAITAAGLTVGESSTVQDDAPKNTVLSQEPAAAAEVPQGTAVDYILSSGPALVTIPEVRDQPAGEAQAALEAEGLVVSTEEKTNAQVAAGDAVKTDPAAGAQVAPGSEVLLTISRGPKPAVVPDITGSLQKDAKAAITAAGLTVGESSTVQDDAPKNTVLSQEPAAAAEVPQGTAVDYILSSGPALVTIPEVRDQPAGEAQAALEAEGLVVSTEEKTNAQVAAGDAVKTDPAAGAQVAPGSEVLLTISRGPKPAVVPDITGLPESEALAALEAANLEPGVRTEAIDETIPRGSVIDESPDDGSVVEQGSDIDYVVSLGPPIPSRGAGGSLDNQTVITQLDAVAATVPGIRELELGNTPYDGASGAEQASLLAGRIEILHEPSTIAQEESALKRLGLLDAGDDLASLLDQLYGQRLPIGYLEQRGRQSVLSSIDKFNVPNRAEAAREFGRAAVLQAFGADAARVADETEGDEARAALALELGDGTATMLDWSTQNVNSGNQSKVEGVIVPGDDGVYGSMPPLLQREYSFPFLEGRLFVDRLREAGGWDTVDSAWGALPESTEQIMHPKLYRSDRPTTIDMSSIAGRLGGGWRERWQQTMGELRIGVWLADGQPGTQQGPRAPIKLPKANAAAGWGGDRLVSLDGPDGSWAIVWQTKWDTPQDIGQFTKAASAAIADLPGSHSVLEADVSSGVSNPALVLLTSDPDTLTAVAGALGVAVEVPAS